MITELPYTTGETMSTIRPLILLTFMLFFSILVPAQNQSHLADREANNAQQRKQSASPPPTVNTGIDNAVPHQTPGTAKNDGQNYTNDGTVYHVTISDNPFHFWLPFFINSVIALVGVVTAGVVVLQVRGLMLSQRAWILVVPDKFDPQRPLYGPEMKKDLRAFPMSIKNVGLSPARIDSVAFRYCVLSDLSTLPTEPNYPQAIPYNGWAVAPQDSVGHIAPLEGGDDIPVLEYDQHIKNGTKVLFAYGCVKYRDIFRLIRTFGEPKKALS
jgi:hypothetical protein